MISQALSIKVIFGVGLGLVVGAILPFIFGKANRHEPAVSELPAWASPTNSSTSASLAQNTVPAWPSSPAVTASTALPPQAPPTQSPAILFPQPPQASNARPAAHGARLAEASRLAAAPAGHAGQPKLRDCSSAVTQCDRDNRGDYRIPDRPVDASSLTADNRNNPASPYRGNDSRYDYRTGPTDGNPVRSDVRRAAYQGDNRYGNGGYPAAAGPVNPSMPSNTPAAPVPMSNYRNQQYPDPGVARFDGTIATPSP